MEIKRVKGRRREYVELTDSRVIVDPSCTLNTGAITSYRDFKLRRQRLLALDLTIRSIIILK
jgi:hypothetical protein